MNAMSKQELTKAVRKRYRAADRKQKGVILNEYTAVTGYNRKYAIRKLNASESVKKDRRGRKKIYDARTVSVLKELWEASGYLCSDRLKPYLPELIEVLKRCRELTIDSKAEELVTGISRAQIDRLLAPYKLKRERRWAKGTKPGSLLKQIPERFGRWKTTQPGHVEIDLVHHGGGSTAGEYTHTLDLVDIHTGWNEQQAVMGRAQERVHRALRDIEERLPFPLLGIDSDNDAPFINHQLFRYTQEKGIDFTRIRPNQKNDNAHIEQKNWHQVRRLLGYQRYDTGEEQRTINRLYKGPVRIWNNFFQPVMKLERKIRTGSKVKRVYDKARTPYQRVLESGVLTEREKTALARLYRNLNPIALRKEIEGLLDKLDQTWRKKNER